MLRALRNFAPTAICVLTARSLHSQDFVPVQPDADDTTIYWIWGALIAIAIGGWLIRDLRSRAAQSWPVADGTVESTTVRYERTGRTERKIAEVNYSYSALGDFYSGAHQVGSESDFDLFPKLSRVIVHFKPGDPSVSFLDREDLRTRKHQAALLRH